MTVMWANLVAVGDLLHAQHRDTRRCQFDRQRDAIEPTADLSDCPDVVIGKRKAGLGGRRRIDKQLHRLGSADVVHSGSAVRRQAQGWHVPDLLTWHTEPLPARRQHAQVRAGGEQRVDKLCARLHRFQGKLFSAAWRSVSPTPMHPRAEPPNPQQALDPEQPAPASWRQSIHLVAMELLLCSRGLPPCGARTRAGAAESHRCPVRTPNPYQLKLWPRPHIARMDYQWTVCPKLTCRSRLATRGAMSQVQMDLTRLAQLDTYSWSLRAPPGQERLPVILFGSQPLLETMDDKVQIGKSATWRGCRTSSARR
jgi:hypothetical protein